jgi:hypothetical protein
MHEKTGLDRPDFDRLIDVALSTYGNADSGLEQRVLARISAGRTHAPRLGRIVWAAVLTAAACLLLFVVLMRARLVHAPERSARNTPTLQQLPKETVHVAPRATQRRSGLPHYAQPEGAAGKFVANRLPKRDVFPTPQPLSPGEQVLVDFAARAPKAEREAFIDAQKQAAEPISIAAIRITPLQIPPLEPPHPGAN